MTVYSSFKKQRDGAGICIPKTALILGSGLRFNLWACFLAMELSSCMTALFCPQDLTAAWMSFNDSCGAVREVVVVEEDEEDEEEEWVRCLFKRLARSTME